MIFTSQQIKGKGRGKGLGFPTINLVIPSGFQLQDGVYAATVTIDQKTYIGAMHFGPIPTFQEEEKSLEIFLLDINDTNFPEVDNKDIVVDVKKYIREVRNFANPMDLSNQIEKDVTEIRSIKTA